MTSQSQLPLSGATSPTDGRAFIEVQFPVSKLSKESYDERKGAQGQALTGLGKWWGRKPLVLVRAIILGLLLPATDDPARDREVFLTLMTMDDDGLWSRVRGSIPARDVYALATPREKTEYFEVSGSTPNWKRGVSRDDRRQMQRRAFLRMNYDRKLTYCATVEEAAGPAPETWDRINAHLGTHAASLAELVQELSRRRLGRQVRVGDAFAGGGNIPFAAARLGCEVYASDLNPVAALLTWGALNIVGGPPEVVERVNAAQQRVYQHMQAQVDAWGIERNEQGWVADAYLYCSEVVDPATGWRVPLAPSWVIAKRAQQVIARLVPDYDAERFDIEIVEGASAEEMAQADAEGTWQAGVRGPVGWDDRRGVWEWLPPSQRQTTSAEQLRGRGGLRRWTADDLGPRPDDVFQERLYCVRWVETIQRPNGRVETRRHYRAPTEADLARERQVLALLHERVADWQARGYIPSRPIEPGRETERLQRERGWTHWHHLFNPRQLLLGGLLAELAETSGFDEAERAGLLLSTGRVADWNSRLCRWDTSRDQGKQSFYNQALNTLLNYVCRGLGGVEDDISSHSPSFPIQTAPSVITRDARTIGDENDIWITDPGYGDTIAYDELSELFLAWYDRRLPAVFPGWYSDSKRALAVKGEGETFSVALAECYQRLVETMSDDGFQVVMFTHQDTRVWADLAVVLWAAGLHVSAAWTIATETGGTGVRQGNYVQGTVVLVCRKRRGGPRGDLSDVYPEVQAEVQRQIETMQALDPQDDPNFGDADYQLAAYAAALRVLTGYAAIDEIDPRRELLRSGADRGRSPVRGLLDQAVRMATNALVPQGLDPALWRTLGPDERLYLKGVQVEAHGEMREGVYQELARGYGADNFRALLATRTANQTRLKTPSELGNRDLRPVGEAGFGGTLLRHLLFAVALTARDAERDPRPARDYLRQEVPNYWSQRQAMLSLLRYLAAETAGLAHWQADTHAARLLLGSLDSDRM